MVRTLNRLANTKLAFITAVILQINAGSLLMNPDLLKLEAKVEGLLGYWQLSLNWLLRSELAWLS
jgi:hypothetical protein